MGRQVDLDDLTDTAGVADMLGLAQRNTVAQYRRDYPDFPQPVLVLNSGQCLVWLRPDIDAWMRARGRNRYPAGHVVVTDPAERPET